MNRLHRATQTRAVGAGLVLLSSLWACNDVELGAVASGSDILEVRAPLTEDGYVGVVRAQEIELTDGSSSLSVDLSAHDLEITPPRRPVQVRAEGDIVFIAESPSEPPCMSSKRGVYHLPFDGSMLTTLHEGCLVGANDARVGNDLAMSPGGTIAFSDIVNGTGAVYRGPAAGPVSVLRSGTGEFFNTRGLDVNDAGRTPVHMEYSDGFAGGLMRGTPVFETPETDKLDLLFAIEKQGIGDLSEVAVNAAGVVALSIPNDVTITLEGMTNTYEAGVYTANPTLFNTLKDLTLVAGTSDGYCRFGYVDINDAGTVVFEARKDPGGGCDASTTFDGIYTGPDPANDAIAQFGDEALLDHQFFDQIILGEINQRGQVSFTTTYSAPRVDPVKVWRADPCRGRRGRWGWSFGNTCSD